MAKQEYTQAMLPIENKVKPNSLIDIYYDPLTLAIVNCMNTGYEISDIVAALNVTKQLRGTYKITNSLLDFTGVGLPAGVTTVIKEVRKLERESQFLPMYIIGMHRNLEILISAVGTMAKLNAFPVQDYQEFVEKVGVQPKPPQQE